MASFIPIFLSVLARLAYNLGWVAQMEIALLAGVISGALGLVGVYGALIFNQRHRLAKAQREDALETTDFTTGLYSERIARARLPQLILRSMRFEKSCGVIMIRWTGYEQFMPQANATERGRIFSHLGNRLNRLARDIDTVARFGDDRFIFLMEAPISREQINEIATRILTSCMRPSPALAYDHGFDLHLALWLSQDFPADADTVLETLKTRLDQMREGTQRRVQFIDTPLTTASPQDIKTAEHAKKLVEKINALEATQELPRIAVKPRDISSN